MMLGKSATAYQNAHAIVVLTAGPNATKPVGGTHAPSSGKQAGGGQTDERSTYDISKKRRSETAGSLSDPAERRHDQRFRSIATLSNACCAIAASGRPVVRVCASQCESTCIARTSRAWSHPASWACMRCS